MIFGLLFDKRTPSDATDGTRAMLSVRISQRAFVHRDADVRDKSLDKARSIVVHAWNQTHAKVTDHAGLRDWP